MSEIEEFCREFAQALADPLELVGFPWPPARPSAGQLYLRGNTDALLDFVDDEGAVWTRPRLMLDAVVIAPGADYEHVYPWCFDRIDRLRRLMSGPAFAVAGHRRPPMRSVGPVGLLDAGSQLWAFEVFFGPTSLNAMEA